MNRFLYTVLFFNLLLFAHTSTAQLDLSHQVISVSGKAATQGGRSYAYTVGEPFVFTLSSDSYKITQGFHQPDLYLPVSTYYPDFAEWNVEVYPNPATHEIHFRYSTEKEGLLSAQVFDVLGRIIVQDFPVNNPSDTEMDCSAWQPGVYFIQLKDRQSQSGATIRVIKV